MSKSGLADSPFFAPTPPKVEPITPSSANPPVEKIDPEKVEKPKIKKTEQPSNSDTTTPRNHDTTVSRYHDIIIELVRKSVKEFGKEAATHRFTEAEKKEIADLLYTYKNRGIKTSENEIARIAVNFVVEDYKVNGENSVLHKLLKALRE